MTIGEDKNADVQLIREEAYEVIAKYHKLPVDALDYELIEKAFQDYADFPSSIHAGAVFGGGELRSGDGSVKKMVKQRARESRGSSDLDSVDRKKGTMSIVTRMRLPDLARIVWQSYHTRSLCTSCQAKSPCSNGV
jgi:hypothetical protein